MHSFSERLTFSEGVGLNADILDHIRAAIPAAVKWEKATTQDDRNGTDYWLFREHGLPPLSFDMKNREFCPINRFGKDDACIETCSVFHQDESGPEGYWRKKQWIRGRRVAIGWTLNFSKRTDWIVYTWPSSQGRRFWIVPFPFLCQATRIRLNEWLSRYPELPAENRSYQTLSVYPLRVEIRSAIAQLMSGTIKGPPLMFQSAPIIGVQLPLIKFGARS